MVLRIIGLGVVAALVYACGVPNPCSNVDCGACPPALSFNVAPPPGTMVAPQVEIRGIDVECGGNGVSMGCSTTTPKALYEFDIAAEGYETIHVRQEVTQTDCGGACCCCGYEPVTLSFTLTPTDVADGGVEDAGRDGGMIPPSSLRVCADYDAGVCINSCDPGEVCFTQVACNPGADGGIGGCQYSGTPADAGVGDNRCHRRCGAACPQGETCVVDSIYGCDDIKQITALCL